MENLTNGATRERMDFSRIKTSIPIPNLIEVQKKSYERFLQMALLPGEREDTGLQSVFKDVYKRQPTYLRNPDSTCPFGSIRANPNSALLT